MHRAALRGQIVAMMQAAESGHDNDFAPGLRITHRYTTGRRFLGQREMRPVLVIVTDILIHQALQIPFVENDHMVKQIASPAQDSSALFSSSAAPFAQKSRSPAS